MVQTDYLCIIPQRLCPILKLSISGIPNVDYIINLNYLHTINRRFRRVAVNPSATTCLLLDNY